MTTCDRCEKETDQLRQLLTFRVCEDCYKEMEHKVFHLREEDATIPCPLCEEPQTVIIVDNMEKPIHPADYKMVIGTVDDYEKDTGRKWRHFPHFDVNAFCKRCRMPCSHMTFESRDAVNNWIRARMDHGLEEEEE